MVALVIPPYLEPSTVHASNLEAKTSSDKKDNIERRRLQNRINQRAHRKRKAIAKGDGSGIVIKQWKAPATSTSTSTSASTAAERTTKNPSPESESGASGSIYTLPTPTSSIEVQPTIFQEFASEIVSLNHVLPPTAEDLHSDSIAIVEDSSLDTVKSVRDHTSDIVTLDCFLPPCPPAKLSHIHSAVTAENPSLYTIETIRAHYKKYLASHNTSVCQKNRPRLTDLHHPLSNSNTFRLPLPGDDRLLSLLYYNVCRGLIHNIALLGLSDARMNECDYPSPFLPMSPTASSAITKLPPSLQPTILQRMISHHPFLDLFPCKAVRDNGLRYTWTEDEEEELCWDIVGLSLSDGEGGEAILDADEDDGRTGASVWGEPWKVDSWEVSSYLARRWAFLFRGAWELERATNARRRARGWKPIYFA